MQAIRVFIEAVELGIGQLGRIDASGGRRTTCSSTSISRSSRRQRNEVTGRKASLERCHRNVRTCLVTANRPCSSPRVRLDTRVAVSISGEGSGSFVTGGGVSPAAVAEPRSRVQNDGVIAEKNPR